MLYLFLNLNERNKKLDRENTIGMAKIVQKSGNNLTWNL